MQQEYPWRGQLQQFRFEESVSFRCYRCKREKKAKLVVIHDDDWSRPMCNGCYGNTLSHIPLIKRQLKQYPAIRQEHGPPAQIIQGGLPSLGKRR
jgi:hypothetical protein